MDWKFNGSKPVYQQIKSKLRDAILTGQFPPGSRVPSVRELATMAKVNPNTMQRALAELEHEEILVGCGTMGRCVTADAAVLENIRRQALEETAENCLRQFRALGLSPRQASELLMHYEAKEEILWTES